MSEVYFFKLVTGEEILAKAERDVSNWTLENPAKLAFTQQGVAMIPYSPLLKQDKIKINVEHVLFHGEVDKEVYNAYNSKFGTGLVLATAGSVPSLKLTGDDD